MQHQRGEVHVQGGFLGAAGALVLAMAVVPGCGGGSSGPDLKGSEVPPVVQESNDNMLNFMNKQKGGKGKAADKAKPAEAKPGEAPKG